MHAGHLNADAHGLFNLIRPLCWQVRRRVPAVPFIGFVQVALLRCRVADEDARPAAPETKDDKEEEIPSLFRTLFSLHPPEGPYLSLTAII